MSEKMLSAAAMTLAAVTLVAAGWVWSRTEISPGAWQTHVCDGRLATGWEHAGRVADRAGLDRAVLRALIQTESSWQRWAVSPAGAEGLMQIVPAFHPVMDGRTFHVCASLRYGAGWLAERLAARGDIREALADYHSGPDRHPQAGLTYADNVLRLSAQIRGP